MYVLNVLDRYFLENAVAIPFNGLRSADRANVWVDLVRQLPKLWMDLEAVFPAHVPGDVRG